MLKSLRTKILLSFLILIFNLPHHYYSVDAVENRKTLADLLNLLSHYSCLEITNASQCKCLSMSDHLILKCNSSEIVVKINEEINVICGKSNFAPLKETVPKATIGLVKKVIFLDCFLNRDESLKDVLGHLGIERFKDLIFVSNAMISHKHQLSGLENVIELIYYLTSANPLPTDLFEGVPNVKSFLFHTNQKFLPKGLFDPMSNLNKLWLNGENDSIKLASGIFQNLKNLEHLDISDNKHLILPKDVFNNAISLKILHLNNNKIISLPRGIFDDLTELSFVNFTGNSFNLLPDDLFRTTTKLEDINLIENSGNLRTLPEEFLANLKFLTFVQLSAGLEELPENLFKESPNIRYINLSKNKLTKLSASLFRDQSNLEKLHLEQNLLTTLPDDIFRHMIHLRKLVLSNNKLTTINNSIFSSLSSLKKLALDNNNLRFIENNSFCHNNALRKLNLSYNDLDINSALPLFHCLDSFVHLRTLDLAYNKITIITMEDLLFLAQNVVIYLQNNQIETVDFSHMKNYLTSAPQVIVFLHDNPIKCDCKITDFVKYMQEKNLDFHLHCEKPIEFHGRSLMDIDSCDLTCPRTEPEVCPERCQCVDRSCDNAFIINCSNTKLFQFPTLPQPNFIKAEKILLDMQNNNLKDLSVEISESYDKIFSLNLTDNNLENIGISHLPARLELLDLSRNNLSILPYHIFDPWSNNASKSKAIYLSQNPWHCNCDLLKFVQNINNKVVDADVLQCLNASNQYQLLNSFKPSQLCPEERNQLTIAIVACVVGGLMFGLLVALCCLYKNEIKIWLYSHNMCLWFVSIEDLEKDKKYDGFVSYSHKDKEFVQQKLLPFLEHGSHPFKICDHERDWLVGDTIPQQIIESVENSRRTLIVLSDNYLDSVWGRMEFQTAHQLSLKEKHPKLIIILYEKITNIEKLDSELKAYLNMNTYVEWGNPWFWKKLLYAMPHSKYSRSRPQVSNQNEMNMTPFN